MPAAVDLIGFVTSANFQLNEGRYEAIGNIAVARVFEASISKADRKSMTGPRARYDGTTDVPKGEAKLCIVRDAGQSLGRLARWSFI